MTMMIPATTATAAVMMRNMKNSKVLYHNKTIPADQMIQFLPLLRQNHHIHLMHLPITVTILMQHRFKMKKKKMTIQSWITNMRRNNNMRYRQLMHHPSLKPKIYLPYQQHHLLVHQQHNHIKRNHIHLNQQLLIHPLLHHLDYLVFGQVSRVHQDAGRLNNNNNHLNKQLWLLNIMTRNDTVNDFHNNNAVFQNLILVMKIYWHKWKISTLPIPVIPKYECWWVSNDNLLETVSRVNI